MFFYAAGFGTPSSPTATPRQVRIPKEINLFGKGRRTVQYLPLYLDAFSKVDQETDFKTSGLEVIN
jgi:hypothetical protein